jgi:hypothetical protein
MAREAGIEFSPAQFSGVLEAEIDEFSLKAFEALVRADEREEGQKWFDAVEWLTGCSECGMDSGCDCDSGTWNPPAAQREWVGLTDKEAMQICVDCGCLSEDWLVLLDAIEAKLKEKNSDL